MKSSNSLPGISPQASQVSALSFWVSLEEIISKKIKFAPPSASSNTQQSSNLATKLNTINNHNDAASTARLTHPRTANHLLGIIKKLQNTLSQKNVEQPLNTKWWVKASQLSERNSGLHEKIGKQFAQVAYKTLSELRESNDHETTEKLCEFMLDCGQITNKVLVPYAESLMAQRKWVLASLAWSCVVLQNNSITKANLNLSKTLFRAGFINEALLIVDEILTINPHDIKALREKKHQLYKSSFNIRNAIITGYSKQEEVEAPDWGRVAEACMSVLEADKMKVGHTSDYYQFFHASLFYFEDCFCKHDIKTMLTALTNATDFIFKNTQHYKLQKTIIDTTIVTRLTRDSYSYYAQKLYKDLNKTKPSTLHSHEWIAIFIILSWNGLLSCSYIARKHATERITQEVSSETTSLDKLNAAFRCSVEQQQFSTAQSILDILTLKSNPKQIDKFRNYLTVMQAGKTTIDNSTSLTSAQIPSNFKRYVQGKRVAIVGPAPTGEMLGKEIDNYDIVVRFNYLGPEYLPDPLEFGTKTNMSYYSNGLFSLLKTKNIVPKTHNLTYAIVKSEDAKQEIKADAVLLDTLNQGAFFGSLNAVPLSLIHLLQCNPREIKLFKSNFFCSNSLYADGYAGRAHDNILSTPYMKKLQEILLGHDLVSQFEIAANLLKLGVISADRTCSEVLKLSKETYMSQLQQCHALATTGQTAINSETARYIDPKILFYIIDLLINNKQWKSAIRIIEEYAVSGTDYWHDAALMLSRAYIKTGEIYRAKRTLKLLTTSTPQQHYAIIDTLMSERNWFAAKEYIECVVGVDRVNLELSLLLRYSSINFQLEHYQISIDLTIKAIELCCNETTLSQYANQLHAHLCELYVMRRNWSSGSKSDNDCADMQSFWSDAEQACRDALIVAKGKRASRLLANLTQISLFKAQDYLVSNKPKEAIREAESALKEPSLGIPVNLQVTIREAIFTSMDCAENNNQQSKNYIDSIARLCPETISAQKWLILYDILCQTGSLVVASKVRDHAIAASYIEADKTPNQVTLSMAFKAAIEEYEIEKAEFYLNELFGLSTNRETLLLFQTYLQLMTGNRKGISGYSSEWLLRKRDKRFCDYIKGKSIALVGPAPTGDMAGDEIDSYDIVIRLNYAGEQNKMTTEEFGRRTDISYFNVEALRDMNKNKSYGLLDNLSFYVYRNHKYTWLDHDARDGRSRTFIKNNMMFNKGPNAIPAAIFDLLCCGASNIKLFKSNFFLSEKPYAVNYAGRISKEKSNSNSFTDLPFSGHDLLSQLSFVRTLWKNNIIEVEASSDHALTLNNCEYYAELQKLYQFR
ncbi:hypothetical protein HNR37_002181 [Desulfurispira natronophila]|uniref:Uncharacterized protein n=1 Tax=Desulfurispira natronophila TaxID=682562 RepID=A0A7W7Y693_9BACT|nr:hypothetical protein [Desulfurispira natronophila]